MKKQNKIREPSRKFYILSVLLCSLSITFSCAIREHNFICKYIAIQSVFLDSTTYLDITGDTVGGAIKYSKDSLYYEIISGSINVSLQQPTVSKDTHYTYTTNSFDISGIDNATLLLIYHLNSNTKDTTYINIIDGEKLIITHENNPNKQFYLTEDCDHLITILM